MRMLIYFWLNVIFQGITNICWQRFLRQNIVFVRQNKVIWLYCLDLRTFRPLLLYLLSLNIELMGKDNLVFVLCYDFTFLKMYCLFKSLLPFINCKLSIFRCLRWFFLGRQFFVLFFEPFSTTFFSFLRNLEHFFRAYILGEDSREPFFVYIKIVPIIPIHYSYNPLYTGRGGISRSGGPNLQ